MYFQYPTCSVVRRVATMMFPLKKWVAAMRGAAEPEAPLALKKNRETAKYDRMISIRHAATQPCANGLPCVTLKPLALE